MSNRNQEEMEEFRQELLEEARQEEMEEYRLRSDYDYFLDRSNAFEFRELYYKLKEEHIAYGWEFDLDYILNG